MNTSPNTTNTVAPRSVIKKEDGFLAYYFSAQIANIIVRTFRRLPITPNHYTFASLVLGFWAAWMFSRGTYNDNLIGLVLLHISFIFDCCDGQVSRLKGLGSKMGHWFDYHSDKMKDGALLLGLSYGVYVSSGQQVYWIFIVAFVTIFFQFMRNITALNRDNFMLEHEGKRDSPYTFIADRGNQLLRTLKNSALFKLSDRVLLYTVAIVVNRPALGLVVYCILEAIFALFSAFINYRLFHRFDKKHS
jgi:phosphatidylglycerophosphate synthase